MQYMVLMAVVVVELMLTVELPSPHGPGWLPAAAVGGYLLGAAALSGLRASLALRAMRGPEGERPGATDGGGPSGPPPGAARRRGLLAAAAQAWLIGGMAAVLLAGYGRWVLNTAGRWPVPLVASLVALAPFLAAMAVRWVLEYPLHRELRRRVAALCVPPPGSPSPSGPARGWRPSLREHLIVNLRYELMLIGLPLALVLTVKDALWFYVHPYLPAAWADWATLAGTLAGAVAVLLVAPRLLAWAWRARPLPPGELRRSLEDLCRRAAVRFAQILIWPSGLNVANAAVLGAVRPFRYVLLTDALVEYMSLGEVLAVFAHEVRHAAARHIPYMVLFAFSTAILSSCLGELAGAALGWPAEVSAFAGAGVLLATWGALFGWISRRFERQCDVYAAWAMGRVRAPGGDPDDRRITPEGAAAFAWALQRVAQLNGMSATRPNWRHGSIAWRVQHVLQLGSSGGTTEPADRLVRRIKAGLWVSAAAAAAALVAMALLAG